MGGVKGRKATEENSPSSTLLNAVALISRAPVHGLRPHPLTQGCNGKAGHPHSLRQGLTATCKLGDRFKCLTCHQVAKTVKSKSPHLSWLCLLNGNNITNATVLILQSREEKVVGALCKWQRVMGYVCLIPAGPGPLQCKGKKQRPELVTSSQSQSPGPRGQGNGFPCLVQLYLLLVREVQS